MNGTVLTANSSEACKSERADGRCGGTLRY